MGRHLREKHPTEYQIAEKGQPKKRSHSQTLLPDFGYGAPKISVQMSFSDILLSILKSPKSIPKLVL